MEPAANQPVFRFHSKHFSVQFLRCAKHMQQEHNILPVSLTLKFLLTYKGKR